jgi:hypothetical protein
MSTAINSSFVSIGNSIGWTARATSDNGLAQEQLPQDAPETDLEDELEEADVEEESYWEPRHIHVPRRLVWAIIILLVLIMAALAVWGWIHSTWWYGSQIPVDAGTRQYLIEMRTQLAAAGAPDLALRQMAIATRPGANVDDAIGALEDADRALEPLKDDATIAQIRGQLRGVLSGLINLRHWGGARQSGSSSASATPLPTLAIR